MEAFTYKGISDGKYVEGDIEALNLDEASHLLKEKKIIITNIIKSKKKTGEKKKKSGSSLFSKSKKVKVRTLLSKMREFWKFFIQKNTISKEAQSPKTKE